VLQLNRRVPPKRDDERDWPAVSQEVVSRWPPASPTTTRRPRHGEAKHAETYHHPTSPSQQQQPVKRGRTSPVRFHFVLRFTTVALARTSDSLVRVSRRADHDRATSSVLGIRQLPRGRPRWRTRPRTCLAPFLGFRLLGNPSPSARPATSKNACVAARNRHCPANKTKHHNYLTTTSTTTPAVPTPTHHAAEKCAHETAPRRLPPTTETANDKQRRPPPRQDPTGMVRQSCIASP
jgi:hypothetical protein